MENHFSFQIQDPCLRFIREDSSQNGSDLFKASNSDSGVKIEEQVDGEQQVNDGELKQQKHRQKQEVRKSESKKKMFYRDKMASLISQDNFMRPEYNYADYNQTGRGKSPISRDQQLKRNRESAKHSRQRRKQYVQTLQQKNSENLATIQDLRRKLKQTEMERDRLREDNGTYVKSFLAAKNEAFENLNETLNLSGKKSTQHISEAVRLMKAKYGAAGSERIATTDYYMKQIVEMLVGDVHKYLMECVLNDAGLFGLGDWCKMDDQIAIVLNVRKQCRVALSRNYRMETLREFQNFKEVTHRFYEAYRAVQFQAKIIQKIFDKISLEFSDECIARLLLWLQQNKFMKDLKKMRSQWVGSIQSPIEITDKVRKMNKGC